VARTLEQSYSTMPVWLQRLVQRAAVALVPIAGLLVCWVLCRAFLARRGAAAVVQPEGDWQPLMGTGPQRHDVLGAARPSRGRVRRLDGGMHGRAPTDRFYDHDADPRQALHGLAE